MCWLQLDFGGSAVRRSSLILCTAPPDQIRYHLVTLHIQAVYKINMSWPWRTWDRFERHRDQTFLQMGSQRNGFKKESFVLSVDVGTTSIRGHVYDKQANIRGSCTSKVFWSFSLSFCGSCPTVKCAKDSFIYHATHGSVYQILRCWCFWFWCHTIQVVPLYPEVGYVEMDPDELWTGFITVVKGAVQGTAATVPAVLSVCKHALLCD